MTSIDQLDDDQALQQLILEFSHRDRTVKTLAIRRSIHFKEKAPRRELIRALTNGYTDTRAVAAEAIEALKPWITKELPGCLPY